MSIPKSTVVKAGIAYFDGVGLYLANWDFDIENPDQFPREVLIVSGIIAALDHIRSEFTIPGIPQDDSLPQIDPKASLDAQRVAEEFIAKARGL